MLKDRASRSVKRQEIGRSTPCAETGKAGSSGGYLLFLLFLTLILLLGLAVVKDPDPLPLKIRFDAQSEICAYEVAAKAIDLQETGSDRCRIRAEDNALLFSFWIPDVKDLRIRVKMVFPKGQAIPEKHPRFFINGTEILDWRWEDRNRKLGCSFSAPGSVLNKSATNSLAIVFPRTESVPNIEIFEIRSYRASSAQLGIWCVLTERPLPDNIFLPLFRHPFQTFAIPLIVWTGLPLLRRFSSKRQGGAAAPGLYLLLLSPACIFSLAVLLIGAFLRIRILATSVFFFELLILPGMLYTVVISIRYRVRQPKTIAAVFPFEERGISRPPHIQTAVVMATFLLLTILLTYPLALKLNTQVCGNMGDKYQFIWNFWWFHKALVDFKINPFFTSYLYHPNGTSLLLSTTTLFNTLLSVPLQALLSRVTIYNLLVLFSFWASAIGMYCLVFHLTRSTLASLVSGIIYSFSAYHFAHALGHLNLLSIEWIPFFILYLIKAFQGKGARNLFIASVFMVLNALCCWYYLVYCLLFLGLAVVYFLIPWNRKEGLVVIRKAVQILCLSAVFLSPLTVPMAIEKARGHYLGGHDPGDFPADLVSFFVPNLTSTYSFFFYPVWSRLRSGPTEGSNYLGLSVLFLVIYSVLKSPRSSRSFWLFMTSLFFLFSLGPFLNILGKALPVPLPYLLYHYLVPFSDIAGVPARFHIMTTACISVLAGYGVKAMWERMRDRRSSRWGRSCSGLRLLPIAIWILIDHLHIPMIVTKTSVSPFFKSLAQEADDYAILDRTEPSQALFFQTIHDKRLIGGYVSRVSSANARFLEETDPLKVVLSGSLSRASKNGPDDAAHARKEFHRLQIKYIVYPKQERTYRFVEGLGTAIGLPEDVSRGLARAVRDRGADDKRLEKKAAEILEGFLASTSPVDILKILFRIRILLADQNEVSLKDPDPIHRSESIVRDVWGFRCVYEDEEIRVYSPSS